MLTRLHVPRARRVIAVRPYLPHIRLRVFSVLERLGLTIDDHDIVAAGTPDAEALARLRGERCGVLLVPFHAHTDRRGVLVHGLGLIAQIRAELHVHADTPVLCPISNVGLAAAGLMTARLPDDAFEGVLFLHEDELDDDAIEELIAGFLAVPARSAGLYPRG